MQKFGRNAAWIVATLAWVTVSSCFHVPHFPDNGRPAIRTAEQYRQLGNSLQAYHGRGVRVAGRIVRAERAGNRITILADWLPWPDGPYGGPGGPARDPTFRFVVEFPGAMDADGLRQGNEFVMTGTAVGARPVTTITGPALEVPAFEAECLHVWKTAGTDLLECLRMDPLDDRYPPPLEETYCRSRSPLD